MRTSLCPNSNARPIFSRIASFIFGIAALFIGVFFPTRLQAQTPAQETSPAGFTPLFDGHSLAGWHTLPRIGVPKTAAEALAPAKPHAKGNIATAQEDAKGRW